MNSHEVFIHIHQGCFAGTGAIVRLPQCQWSKPDGCGKISQCITTIKQKPCAYFLAYTVYHSNSQTDFFTNENIISWSLWLFACNAHSRYAAIKIVWHLILHHYSDIIMGSMASSITSLSLVYSTVCLGADQWKHQSSASLTFVGGIHTWPVNSLTNGQ